jgi:hypothetical protein
MYKLASVALTSVLSVAGIACATPAKADPYFRAEVVLPGVVVQPFAYAPGYYSRYYAHGPYGYWHRDYDRERFEHRRWDHDGDRRDHDWHRGWDRR